MGKLSIEEFSPTRAQLNAVVEETKKTDITNFEAVKENRLRLRTLRVNIEKTGKALREDALKFQKDVIAKEKEYIAVIEPEEERLYQIEEEFKLKKEMETRRAELPSRLEALAGVGDKLPNDENEILAMDDNEFNAYRLRRIDAKLEKDRADMEAQKEKEAIERTKREQVEAEARAKVEREAAEARAKADLEASQKRSAEDAKAEAIRKVDQAIIDEEKRQIAAEKERIAADERARQKAEADRKAEVEMKEREAKAASEKLAAEEKMANFQKFLAENEATDDGKEFRVIWVDGEARLYKLVATYQPNK